MKDRKYDGWKEIQAKVPEELVGKKKGEVGVDKEEDNKDDEDEEVNDDPSMPDYNYLLDMKIWSLTQERINKMKE